MGYGLTMKYSSYFVFDASFCMLSNFSSYLLILRYRAAFSAKIGLSSVFYNILVDNL